MKKIELSSLVPGTVCEADLFTEGGELLVSKGMTLSEKHIDIMRRRNIYDVFMKRGDEAEELHQILARDFKELEDLQFDEPSHSVPISPKKFAQPKAQGYPKQRNGRFIHNYSKIVQIADVFESLSAPREYRTAYIPYRAMEILIKMSRKNLLANEYVKAFITYMSLFPVGSLIEISDHTIGKVVHANELHFTKPIVSIITDAKGSLLPRENIYQVDLCKNQALQIIRAVESNHLPGLDIMHGF
jgi:hypothetical protein